MKKFANCALAGLLGLGLAYGSAWGQNTAERYAAGATTPEASTTGTDANAFYSVVESGNGGKVVKIYSDFNLTGNNLQLNPKATNNTADKAISWTGVTTGSNQWTISNHSARFYDYGNGYYNFSNLRFQNCGYAFSDSSGAADWGAILWTGSYETPITVNCENVTFDSCFAGGGLFSTTLDCTLSGTYSILNTKSDARRVAFGGAIYAKAVTLTGDGSVGTFSGNGLYSASNAAARTTANDIYSTAGTTIEGSGTYSFDGGIVAKGGLTIGDAAGSATNVTFKTGAINTITGDITVNAGATVTYESGVTQTNTGNLINSGSIVTASTLQNLVGTSATASVSGTNVTLTNSADTTYAGKLTATTLTKTGSAKLTLSGANGVSGLVTVSEGALSMPMALGKSAHIAEGASLYASMNLATSATTQTFTVTGSGDLYLQGNSWLRTTSGLNAFTGDIYVKSGTFGISGTFGNTVSAIHLAGGILRNCEVNAEYKNNIVIDSSDAASVRPGWATRTLTLSGVISDGKANTLIVGSDSNLDSILVLTNANNTYSNTTIQNGSKGGRVKITNTGALGTGTVTVTKASNSDPTVERTYLDLNGCEFYAWRLAGGGEVTNTNTAAVSRLLFRDSASLTNSFTGNIQLVKTGSETIDLGTDTKLTLPSGGLAIEEGTISYHLGSNPNAVGDKDSNLVLDGGTLKVVQKSGTGANPYLRGQGTGTVAIGANGGKIDTNAYRAAVTNGLRNADGVTNAGVLTIGSSVTSGDKRFFLCGASTFNGGFLVQDGAYLHATNKGLNGNLVTLNGGVLQYVGEFAEATEKAEAITNNIELGNGGGRLQTGWDANCTFTGSITDAAGASNGTLSLNSDSGTLWLNGNINISGKLDVTGALNSNNSYRNRTNGANSIAVGGLTGSGYFDNSKTAGTSDLILNLTKDASFDGKLSGAFHLVKKGANTQTITGSLDHTGGTEIQAGTLKMTSTGSASLGSGGVTLTGGTLALGTGTYDLGDVTGGAGTIFLDLSSASSYTKLTVDSFTNAEGILDFNPATATADSYDIFTAIPTTGIDWEQLLSENVRTNWILAPNAQGGVTLSLDHNAVPEPAAWLLLLLGGVLPLWFGKKRTAKF